MQINEKTYEEVLYKLLLVESAQGTKSGYGVTKQQLLTQLNEWIESNAPIGIGTLLDHAKYLDNFGS